MADIATTPGGSLPRRILIGLAAIALLALVLTLTLRRSKPGEDFALLMNLGKGHIENRETDNAVSVLRRAVAQQPESAPALRNLARAHLIPKRVEDYRTAVDLLKRALAVNPDSAASQYLMGLALNGCERYDEALPFFERAVQLDPNTATLRHQLADAYQKAGAEDKAFEQLVETIRLEPTHTTAYYKLASHARRARDRDAVVRYTNEFQRLKELLGVRPPDILDRCVHTNPEPALATDQAVAAAPAIPVQWTDATDDAFPGDASRSATTAAVIEVSAAGVPSAFTVTPSGERALLRYGASGKFERTVVGRADPDLPRFSHCAVGDFFITITKKNKALPKNEARNDVLLIGTEGARLYERTGDDTFEDRTQAVGFNGVAGDRAAWIDYDHNGVLDLFVAGETGLQLYENHSYVIRFDSLELPDDAGILRFENATERVGITDTGPVTDVALTELEGNGAVDILAAGPPSTHVFVNQRAGQFTPMSEPPGPWPAARRVASNDLDNDGYFDNVLIDERSTLALYGQSDRRKSFEHADVSAAGGTFIDYDNDGWLDLLVYGAKADDASRGAIRLWRNDTTGSWTDTAATSGIDNLDLPPIVDALAADFDNDGDTDLLLVTTDDALRFLRNDGGNANRQLKIRLVSILTNPSGIGNRIEVRDRRRWVSRLVTRVPIEIGIADSEQLDTVHNTWTNGVVDNEFLVVPASEPLVFTEKMVELGSCPFLFAWNGERFRFVTDILGNAPVGLSLMRDVILPADPDEVVYVGTGDDLVAKDGHYILEVAECYREVLYLDAAELVAVDHPTGIEVHPTDKLMPPPFPASELWAMKNVRTPLSVESSDNIDRLEAIQAIDSVFAPPGEVLPAPFRGQCHPMTLALDFGPVDNDAPFVLALTGWLRYGSASVNIAMAQNDNLPIMPPTLEVETADGGWRPVDVVVGMPAGKTKTILCDLTGKLPDGARRLRLTTTFEIRWDRIALAERTDLPARSVNTLSPVTADLYERGFPEMATRAPHHPITPDYHRLMTQPPWRGTIEGWCTRYGDVLELLERSDEKLVIANGGDAVTLRYDAAALPPRPVGTDRSFYFRAVGWEKDADYNVVDGQSVEPLPVAPTHNDDSWQTRFNTRWVPSSSRDSVNATNALD